jgi:hypothetical protein
MRMLTPRSLLLALVFLAPQVAQAEGGVIEINHSCATSTGCGGGDDTPGYPVKINVGGAYVLTSNLAPVNEDAIIVSASHVSIDLAGFEIAGNYKCSALPCAAGTTTGISAASPTTGLRVRNGTVRGFGLDGVQGGDGARVEGLTVRAVGRHGLNLGPGSVALENGIDLAGGSGMALGASSLYRDNTIRNTGARSVEGGRASGPNQCPAGGCGRRGVPLFYLASQAAYGDGALNVCALGFHMASLWEIHDLGAVEYDSTRGQTNSDSGSGPPAGRFGWVRTGWTSAGSSFAGGLAGILNCAAWTSRSSADGGTYAGLGLDWDADAAEPITPWQAQVRSCDQPGYVWCVQD